MKTTARCLSVPLQSSILPPGPEAEATRGLEAMPAEKQASSGDRTPAMTVLDNLEAPEDQTIKQHSTTTKQR